MSGNVSKSTEWSDAYAKATSAATLPSEKELIRLLALPIHANDRAGISKRVHDFRTLIAGAPGGDLKQIAAKLVDSKSGLSRLLKLELSTSLSTDLLTRIHNRVGRNDAGLNSGGRGLGTSSAPSRGVRKDRLGTAAPPPKTVPRRPDVSVSVGPIEIGAPVPDDTGNHLIVISGSVQDKPEAMRVIAEHLSIELRKTNAKAKVETTQLPDSTGKIQPTIKVSNVGGYELWLGIAAVQGTYLRDLNANTVSQERYDEMQAAKAWARVFQKLGNLYNPVPFTEFNDQGFEFTGFNSPLDALSLIRGVKDIRKLKGEGKIVRKALGGLADVAVDLKKVSALLKKGVDVNAWERAIGKLNAAETALLRKMAEGHAEVLQAIKAGQRQKAYNLVKKWREPARKLYNKVRDLYWEDPKVRQQWKDVGADMSKNAPTFLVEKIENGKKTISTQAVTLEHKTRVNDNPFLAVSKNNLVKSFGYENSVILEDIRRIERGTNTVWSSSDAIELFVRTIELETK